MRFDKVTFNSRFQKIQTHLIKYFKKNYTENKLKMKPK